VDTPADNTLTRRQALGLIGALALPWENVLAQTANGTGAPNTRPATAPAAFVPVDPNLTPDLANFDTLFQQIARDHGPRLSFLEDRFRSLDDWKQVARPAFRELLGYQPKALPLTTELISRDDRGGYTLEVVHIHATASYHIPARVLVPKGRSGKLPAVLALHCHSGRYTWGYEKVISSPTDSATLTEFRTGRDGRPWAESLVKRGYIVIAIDAFYFGERRLRVEDLVPSRVFPEVKEAFEASRKAAPGSPEWIAATNRVCSFYEHHTAKTIFATGATWQGIHAWDEMRTVDYLLSRPDVDGNRIGCIGLSGGGFRTDLLIASDPRIKAACVTGWMTAFQHQLRHHIRHTWMAWLPGLYRVLDLPDAAGLHAPGALLVQQCRQDQLYPMSGMQAAIDKLSRIYTKAGIPERFRGTFHDVPHSFQPQMQDEAFDWMDRWL
jgi:dienelactone hydrolase